MIATQSRTITAVLATDAGVEVFDPKTGKTFPEYLLMSGAKLPKQLVLVDSGDNSTVQKILGSVRRLEVRKGRLQDVAYFAQSTAAQEAEQDIRDGHLSGAGLTFRRRKQRDIPSGKSETIGGQRFNGPARVVTQWEPLFASAVTVPADKEARFGS